MIIIRVGSRIRRLRRRPEEASAAASHARSLNSCPIRLSMLRWELAAVDKMLELQRLVQKQLVTLISTQRLRWPMIQTLKRMKFFKLRKPRVLRLLGQALALKSCLSS